MLLETLVSDDLIAIDEGGGPWSHRAEIFAGAQRAAANGSKLVRLEFPETEMQVYGGGLFIVLYTSYAYELEHAGGTRTTATGRGTEIFVRRANHFVNVGWHLDAVK